MVAMRWVGWSLFAALAGAVALLAITHSDEPKRQLAAPEMSEVVRCADSAAPAIARLNSQFDRCLVEKTTESRSLFKGADGRTHVVVPEISDIRICLRKWMCGQEPTHGVVTAKWRVWRNESTEPGSFAPMLACTEVYEGGARIQYGADGGLIQIEAEEGSDVDGCLAAVAELARKKSASWAAIY